ncbi:MAG TPA: FG-GAP-like repeat-containing protein [Bacteroidota bacterium]|jgi:predicted nucleotidyltransferase|nr:FG-GAP-like repeat-containing protein [Bacteroidota bacterium]
MLKTSRLQLLVLLFLGIATRAYADTPRGFVASVHLDTTAFTDISAGMTGAVFSSGAWVDYDNDGDLDVFISGISPGFQYFSKIYRNDAGSFTDINAGLAGVQSEHNVAWGDYDNDGDLDLLLMGQAGPPVSLAITKIYRNDGGVFVNIGTPIPGLMYGSAAWGDYDNDGDLDILVTGSPDQGLSFFSKVYRNDNGSFVDINAGLPGVWGSSAVWGDYDNDGDLDIFLNGYGDLGGTSLIFRNTNGVFTSIGGGLGLKNSGQLAVGDFDNDGDIDVLCSGDHFGAVNAFTTIYRNDNGTFVDTHPGLVQVEESAQAWGDYDNDGDLDILIAGYRDSDGVFFTKVYRNDGGIFTDIGADLPGTANGTVAWGDYDNDGDLDILVVGGTSDTAPFSPIARIYRNNLGSNTFSPNSTPTIPANLASAVQANSVRLSWDRSTDSQTDAHALTYNLRVGTLPSGSQTISPMANGATGYRQIVQLGNANLDSSWTLKGLPAGTYYWSVQAIDNAFAGSPFGGEQSFVISPMGVSEIPGSIPSVTRLVQNYPNPFNPTTTVPFDLAHDGSVRIEIYNILGQNVKKLAESDLHAGRYEAAFNGSDLPSGIYYCRMTLQSGGSSFNEMKKLVMMK